MNEEKICYRGGAARGDSYQMLSPRDWDVLYFSDGIMDIATVVDSIEREQRNLLQYKGGAS